VSTTVSWRWLASSSEITVERVTSFSRCPCFIRRTRTGAGSPPMKRPTYEYAVPASLEAHPSPAGIGRTALSPLAEFRISIVAPVSVGSAPGSSSNDGAVTSRRRWRVPESFMASTDASSG
jgi:hypothetical protein